MWLNFVCLIFEIRIKCFLWRFILYYLERESRVFMFKKCIYFINNWVYYFIKYKYVFFKEICKYMYLNIFRLDSIFYFFGMIFLNKLGIFFI